MTSVSAILDSAYGQHPRQRYDVFVPQTRHEPVLIACVPGSGWASEKHEDLRPLALVLAGHGFAVATIGHRPLGDGARIGQELCDDVRTAIEKAVEEAAVLGAAPHSVVIVGSGAGSLPAMVAATQLSGGKLSVRALVACGVQPTLEPWDSCSPAKAKLFEQFSGGVRHLLNPLEIDATRFPPVLLVHGDSDPEVPAKLVTRLHTRLIEAGESSTLAILAGLPHLALEQPYERGGKAALERILPFLKEHAQEPEAEQLFAGNRS